MALTSLVAVVAPRTGEITRDGFNVFELSLRSVKG